MYVRSLTMRGFKSFLERARLSFDPGLSVVVGPNGSGKSNISDAILWVLGEQSARALRGQAMEDVIFAGSAHHRAVGVAEVTITFDNADRALPLDFAEVAITRRMYRTGESEYLVNGAPVRLRDIRDLLHDMGLGKDTPSIISQGHLDEVLQSKPEERRSLIEEAAGIAKYRHRKELAERKLARLDDDVRRVRDIARILRRDLRPLERQVDQARRFGELTERRDLLLTTLAVEDLRELQTTWGDLETRQSTAAAEVELGDWRLAERERERARLRRLLEEKGLFAGDLESQRHRSQQALIQSSGALRLLDEKGRHLVSRLSETRRNLAEVEREAEEVVRALEADTAALAEARTQGDAVTARLGRLGPERADAQDREEAALAALDRARASLRAAERAADEATLRHARLSQELSQADVLDEMYASRLGELDASRTEALAAREAQSQALADARGSLESLNRELEGARSAYRDAQGEQERTHAALARAEAALVQAEAEAEALRAALAAAATASEVAVEALPATRLVDVLAVPEGLGEAVASYLGPDLEAHLCDDEEGLTALVVAIEHDSPDARTSLVARGSCGEEVAGADAGEADAGAGLWEALFGDVAVADSAVEALRARGGDARTYLCRDGSVVFADGRVRLGNAGAEGARTLGSAARLRELESDLPELESAKRSAEDADSAAREALERSLRAQGVLEADVAAAQAAADAASREVGRLEAIVERSDAERVRIERERAEAASKAERDREELERLAQVRAETAAAVESARSGLPELEEDAANARTLARQARDELATAELAASRAQERIASLERSRAALGSRRTSLEERREGFEETSRALEVLRQRIAPLHEALDALHEVALAKAELLRQSTDLAEADSVSLRASVEEAEEQVARARRERDGAKERAQELRAQGEVVGEQVRQAVERVRSIGALSLEEALELPEVGERAVLERELSQAEEAIEGMGPVNQAAVAQYEEARQRLETIEGSLADLTGARDALTKIGRAIDRKMRTRFLDTFEVVNRNFSRTFRTLFGGGDAHLEMGDPDHPAETGIEVRAQPPGKRVTKMTLLSGGERSLTALALLFAVYRTRTVPFYVFDEVEQALDDANLHKLLGALDELKRQTQLIVISHQRSTMEQADVLYGVSMSPEGVSQVVSQRLQDFRPEELALEGDGEG